MAKNETNFLTRPLLLEDLQAAHLEQAHAIGTLYTCLLSLEGLSGALTPPTPENIATLNRQVFQTYALAPHPVECIHDLEVSQLTSVQQLSVDQTFNRLHIFPICRLILLHTAVRLGLTNEEVSQLYAHIVSHVSEPFRNQE